MGELESVYAAVAELPPALRETLVAVDIVGLSYRQAADALGVKQGTIMSRLYRARNAVADASSKPAPPAAAGGLAFLPQVVLSTAEAGGRPP